MFISQEIYSIFNINVNRPGFKIFFWKKHLIEIKINNISPDATTYHKVISRSTNPLLKIRAMIKCETLHYDYCYILFTCPRNKTPFNKTKKKNKRILSRKSFVTLKFQMKPPRHGINADTYFTFKKGIPPRPVTDGVFSSPER